MFLLYSALAYLLVPVALLYLLLRSLREPEYRQCLSQRFGLAPSTAEHAGDSTVSAPLWVHAVSLGEVNAVLPLLDQWQAPDGGCGAASQPVRVMLTTSTATGWNRAQDYLASRGNSGLTLSYAPFDTPDAVARFLSRVRPAALVLVETELWPNWLRACRRRRVPVVVINARLSAASAARYRRWRWLLPPVFERLTRVMSQSEADTQRFVLAGVPRSQIEVTGNLKFDVSVAAATRDAVALLRQTLHCADRFVWIAASTHPGEERVILDAFARLRRIDSDSLLILVPRHPQRSAELLSECRSAGWHTLRRSDCCGDTQGHPRADVLLVDTAGELAMLYGLARVAFVGGSLVPRGGQNPLEPAAWGLPILMGPHVDNFAIACQALAEAGALHAVASSADLVERLAQYAQNEGLAVAEGGKGLAILAAHGGATQRTVEGLGAVLCEAAKASQS